MPCIKLGNTILCGPSGPYLYRGILWEWHSYIGPHPIRKRDLEPWSRVPNKVWLIANEFAAEPDRERFIVG